MGCLCSDEEGGPISQSFESSATMSKKPIASSAVLSNSVPLHMVETSCFRLGVRDSWNKLTNLHDSKPWWGQAINRSLNLSHALQKFSLGLHEKVVICL